MAHSRKVDLSGETENIHSFTVAHPVELILENHCFDAGLSFGYDTGVGSAVFPLDAKYLPKAALLRFLCDSDISDPDVTPVESHVGGGGETRRDGVIN